MICAYCDGFWNPEVKRGMIYDKHIGGSFVVYNVDSYPTNHFLINLQTPLYKQLRYSFDKSIFNCEIDLSNGIAEAHVLYDLIMFLGDHGHLIKNNVVIYNDCDGVRGHITGNRDLSSSNLPPIYDALFSKYNRQFLMECIEFKRISGKRMKTDTLIRH